MREKRKTGFNYMTMMPFGIAIVLKGVWRGGEVRNATSGKKFVKGLVFPTIIRIKGDDLLIEVFFDKSFESNENIVHMRFVF